MIARVASCLCLLLLLAACSDAEPCAVPGVAAACSCGSAPGARVCSDEREWGKCDCSGGIPLPVAVMQGEPLGGMGGGGGTGGTGGKPVTHDSGVRTDSAVPSDAGEDAYVPPAIDSYGACMADTDCDPDAKCIQTAGFPTSTVCAPACVNTSDCPVPEGMYEAKMTCATGYCQLDCTPVVFAPLLTCPTGMTCIVTGLGVALCHDDGM